MLAAFALQQEAKAKSPAPAGKSAAVGDNPGGIRQSLQLKPKPGHELAAFGAGCFWGIETKFRQQPGVVATAVGYAGGRSKNPTYEQVLTGTTGHVETVLVEFDPKVVSYDRLLNIFWAWHNPTLVNRQGPDIGEQYRSAIWTFGPTQPEIARKSIAVEQKNWRRPIVTTVTPAPTIWLAEEYHQQYGAKTGRICVPPRNFPVGD